MKTKFRTRVFKRAWEISHQTGKSFSICLVKAWQVYRLKKRMAKETVKSVLYLQVSSSSVHRRTSPLSPPHVVRVKIRVAVSLLFVTTSE